MHWFSLWVNLKVQRSLIGHLLLYEFELDHNGADATKKKKKKKKNVWKVKVQLIIIQ